MAIEYIVKITQLGWQEFGYSTFDKHGSVLDTQSGDPTSLHAEARALRFLEDFYEADRKSIQVETNRYA